MPGVLDKSLPILKMTSKGQQLDELVVSMNEAAMPLAKLLLMNAIKSMSITDAKNILRDGDTSMTDFLGRKHRLNWARNDCPSSRA